MKKRRINYSTANKKWIIGKLLRDDGYRGHSIYLVIKEDTGKIAENNPYADDYGAPLVLCDFCYYTYLNKIEFDAEYEIFREKLYLDTDSYQIRSVMT